MESDVAGALDRQPTLQTVTWLLSLRKFGQLDLDPPYQRKSVWTLREKRMFLDTVFRNFPSPAIFLHRDLDDDGNATYHVVDGKQRLSTILDFADNKLRLPSDFGDSRLDGANWKSLAEFPAARKAFWAYELTVEFIDDVQETLVREIFSRLNQNSRKLERQELRHARFDGWLLSFVESQAENEAWRVLKVSTPARSRRMADAQLILELAQVLLESRPVGFDQDRLDELCAQFDDVNILDDAQVGYFEEEFSEALALLLTLNGEDGFISSLFRSRNNLYSIWSVVALAEGLSDDTQRIRSLLEEFFAEVDRVREAEKADPQRDRSADDVDVLSYVLNSSGAATEAPQRLARHEALRHYLLTTSDVDTTILA
ncbi:DUF262 domain-containing protein [uncultured Microbacterium sp.]|uniref:DUF262 domain-containing protein n=1 Tax=uncultured Microbacterium sp. TaxID=191216 RepID=UPI0025EDCCB8|nr:DUF262 domain-containing protein [uncultured Microbacterium sp.]